MPTDSGNFRLRHVLARAGKSKLPFQTPLLIVPGTRGAKMDDPGKLAEAVWLAVPFLQST